MFSRISGLSCTSSSTPADQVRMSGSLGVSPKLKISRAAVTVSRPKLIMVTTSGLLAAVCVDGLLGAARGAARLGLVVAGDVLDALALDLHPPLVEGHFHAAVEDGP